MTATAPATKFGATDCDDFDPCFSEQRICIGVAVISHYYAGFESHNVIAVVPQLALCLVCVASSLNNTKLLKSKSFLHYVEQRLALFADSISSCTIRRVHAVAPDLINYLAEDS